MREVACLPDQVSGAYCYIEAVHNTDPTDLYFYSLPFGTALPGTIYPSCSACTKSVMAQYAGSLSNVTALAKVYKSAAQTVNNVCGQNYAEVSSTSASSRTYALHSGYLLIILGISWVLVRVTL